MYPGVTTPYPLPYSKLHPRTLLHSPAAGNTNPFSQGASVWALKHILDKPVWVPGEVTSLRGARACDVALAAGGTLSNIHVDHLKRREDTGRTKDHPKDSPTSGTPVTVTPAPVGQGRAEPVEEMAAPLAAPPPPSPEPQDQDPLQQDLRRQHLPGLDPRVGGCPFAPSSVPTSTVPTAGTTATNSRWHHLQDPLQDPQAVLFWDGTTCPYLESSIFFHTSRRTGRIPEPPPHPRTAGLAPERPQDPEDQGEEVEVGQAPPGLQQLPELGVSRIHLSATHQLLLTIVQHHLVTPGFSAISQLCHSVLCLAELYS